MIFWVPQAERSLSGLTGLRLEAPPVTPGIFGLSASRSTIEGTRR
jgi:hypothetical protein